MCFHTNIKERVEKLEKKFKVELPQQPLRDLFNTPQYHLNGFAHPNMLVIPQEFPKLLVPGVWGIVPENKASTQIKDYHKSAVSYGGGLNARSEKLFDHFIYKNSALTRRCIIPISGFFEPHEHNKKKYPFYILRADNEPMALAGLYTVIGNFVTFSILTKNASPLLEQVHNAKKRQPVILQDEQIALWLSNQLAAIDVQKIIDAQFPDQDLKAYTVSKTLFSPKADSNIPSITDKVIYAELAS